MIWWQQELQNCETNKINIKFYQDQLEQSEKYYNDKKNYIIERIKAECLRQNVQYHDGLLGLISSYSKIPSPNSLIPSVEFVIESIKRDLDNYKKGTFNQEMKEIINE